MAPPFLVKDSSSAKNQLAALYLTYRRLRIVANAVAKITKALTQNPQGGTPIPGTNALTITVHPVRAIYEIRATT
jgi:hypothetical protein